MQDIRKRFKNISSLQSEIHRLKTLRKAASEDEMPKYIKALDDAIKKADDELGSISNMIMGISDEGIRAIFIAYILENQSVDRLCGEFCLSKRSIYRKIEEGFNIIKTNLKEESHDDI